MFGVVGVLLDGGLVVTNARSLGWIMREYVSHVVIMIKNQGFGLSCGISLRRSFPLSLA